MKDAKREGGPVGSLPEPKHQFEHDPTVIHDPEEDMTLLAKWLKHSLEQGGSFWYWVAGIVAAVVLGAVAASNFSGTTSDAGGWDELLVASTPGQMVEVAEEHPTSASAQAARLSAAAYYASQGVQTLTTNRDTAMPELRKALDLFQEAAKAAAPGSPEGLIASMGVARILETRGELPEAIEQYKKVASGWPTSPEAKDAERLAKLLQQPEVVAFYSDLHRSKPASAVLPPGGSTNLSLPGLPPNHPDLNGPAMPAPGLTLPPLPPGGITPGSTAPGTIPAVPTLPGSTPPAGETGPLDIAPPPASTPAMPALPGDPFTKPAAEPKAGDAPVLPSDPFAKPAAPK